MKRIGEIYKANAAASTLMLSNYTTGDNDTDFWAEYRNNHANYDRVFNRMFNSFYPFLQLEDDTLEEVVDSFRQDVYDHLLINTKKYEELYRIQVIPDEDYSLTNNYDVTETMDKDVTDNQDNEYGSRSDSGSFTKGSRTDNTTVGEQTTTVTEKVAPYDSSDFANNSQGTTVAGQRQDSFTEGQQLDSSSSTKGSQTDNLDRTYTEDYTLKRYGNIGVQTATDMISKHKSFWDMWSFYEYIFKEICKELLMI